MSSSVASPSPPSPASATAAAKTEPAQGEAIFQGQVPIEGFVACRTCHFTDPAAPVGVGPNLAGIATRGAERIPGLTAPEYIRRSIQVHDEYTVPGYAPGIARAVVGRDFAEVLSESQVEQLVAYLMTLDEPPVVAAAVGGVSSTIAPSTPTLSRPTSGATVSPRLSPTRSATPAPSSTAPPAASPTVAPSATSANMSDTPAPSVPPIGTSTSPPTATTEPAPAPTSAPPTLPPPPSATTEPAAAPSVPPTGTSVPPTGTGAPPPTATTEPAPAPTPTPAPLPAAATPTAAPTAESLPIAPDDSELARYAPCVACHDQHPLQVKMPHPLNPTCNECHRGAPNRIGCPSCHSMHGVEYHEPDPGLACATCHT